MNVYEILPIKHKIHIKESALLKTAHSTMDSHTCIICGQRFINEHLLAEHHFFHTLIVYICERCNLNFDTPEDFLTHCRTHHG